MTFMKDAAPILVVDRDVRAAQLLAQSLKTLGWSARGSADTRELLERRSSEAALTAVVLDAQHPDVDALELCATLVRRDPALQVILTSTDATVELTLRALRAGADDFLVKPLSAAMVGAVLERRRPATRRAVTHGPEARLVPGLVGDSPALRRLLDVLLKVASSEASALITGESGVGKEVVAQALHAHSLRAQGPFVALSCPALSEKLLETAFQRAHGGTLFLDEVGGLPLALQPKLLRALQERMLRPAGGGREIPVDVRLLAATNEDLDAAVEARRFREDLFFRINVVTLKVPPLRERGDDVLLLAQHFREQLAARSGKRILGFSAEAADALRRYDWPGNVRELQNCVERAVTLARAEVLTPEDLPERITAGHEAPLSSGPKQVSPIEPMETVERKHIVRALEAAGNKTLAARMLGFDRSTLYRKIEHHRLSG